MRCAPLCPAPRVAEMESQHPGTLCFASRLSRLHCSVLRACFTVTKTSCEKFRRGKKFFSDGSSFTVPTKLQKWMRSVSERNDFYKIPCKTALPFNITLQMISCTVSPRTQRQCCWHQQHRCDFLQMQLSGAGGECGREAETDPKGKGYPRDASRGWGDGDAKNLQAHFSEGWEVFWNIINCSN